MSPVTRLVVKITAAPEPHDSLERLGQGLTVAATAAASGLEVSLWLTGEATRVALADRERAAVPRLEHSAPLTELVETVLTSGQVTVCAQCAQRRGLTDADLVEGARIAGAATFVEEAVADGARALVY